MCLSFVLCTNWVFHLNCYSILQRIKICYLKCILQRFKAEKNLTNSCKALSSLARYGVSTCIEQTVNIIHTVFEIQIQITIPDIISLNLNDFHLFGTVIHTKLFHAYKIALRKSQVERIDFFLFVSFFLLLFVKHFTCTSDV